MAAKKRKYKPREFESTGVRNDVSANIYRSMFFSPAFLDMSKNQRLLYVCMKGEFYSTRKPGMDHPDIFELQGDSAFYFNMSLAEKYGLYSRNNNRQFYNDIKAVESHGFIKTISSGKATHTRTIYKFSDAWKKWSDSG